LAKEGILAGSSSGTLLAAALRYCREQNEPKRVVTFVCDSGNKYLSKMFNDYWMLDQGFLEREARGDLGDLVSRRHEDRATVTVGRKDSLLIALNRMKLYDISQLPVLGDNDKVVGIVDEEDILFRVMEAPARFRDPVEGAMSTRLETLDVHRPLADLKPIFAKGHVAVVVDDERFLGLVTRMDLLSSLRRRIA
jgi:cystathionine beta-synthase